MNEFLGATEFVYSMKDGDFIRKVLRIWFFFIEFLGFVDFNRSLIKCPINIFSSNDGIRTTLRSVETAHDERRKQPLVYHSRPITIHAHGRVDGTAYTMEYIKANEIVVSS